MFELARSFVCLIKFLRVRTVEKPLINIVNSLGNIHGSSMVRNDIKRMCRLISFPTNPVRLVERVFKLKYTNQNREQQQSKTYF